MRRRRGIGLLRPSDLRRTVGIRSCGRARERAAAWVADRRGPNGSAGTGGLTGGTGGLRERAGGLTGGTGGQRERAGGLTGGAQLTGRRSVGEAGLGRWISGGRPGLGLT
jgi:hypothetical protein